MIAGGIPTSVKVVRDKSTVILLNRKSARRRPSVLMPLTQGQYFQRWLAVSKIPVESSLEFIRSHLEFANGSADLSQLNVMSGLIF